jgi:hypothetical protein
MLLIAGGMPDCGRYLQQSQVRLRCEPQSCRMSRPTSELAPDRTLPTSPRTAGYRVQRGWFPSELKRDIARNRNFGTVRTRVDKAATAIGRARRNRRTTMFEFRDLFQWDRFITPGIIKTFYWLVIGLVILFGISGVFSGLAAMAVSPFAGVIVVLYSLAGTVVGIIFSRIAAEFVLIIFRINEHLGAIRDQGQRR